MTPELIPLAELAAGAAPRCPLRPPPGQALVPGWWRLQAELVAEGEVVLNPALWLRLAAPHPRAGEEALVPLPLPRGGRLRALFELPPVAALGLQPCAGPGRFRLCDVRLERLSRPALAVETLRVLALRPRPLQRLAALLRAGWPGWSGLRPWLRLWLRQQLHDDYPRWAAVHGALTPPRRDALLARLAGGGPEISLVVVAGGAAPAAVEATVESLRRQLYPRWQLLLVGGPEAAAGGDDARLQRLAVPAGLVPAEAVNTALALARGELVGWLAAGDELAEPALARAAEALGDHPETHLLYTGEDHLDAAGIPRDPDFKPDWNPDLCYAAGLFGGLTLYRTARVRELGGWRPQLAEAASFDLALRLLETLPSLHGAAAAAQVRHLPEVLCHRRTPAPAVAAPAACRALTEHLQRRGVAAEVLPGGPPVPHRRVRYPLPDPAPRVSVIVPTRDRPDLLARCARGLLRRTDYPQLELLLIDHDSRHPRARRLLARLSADPRVTVLPFSGPFNHSAMCNLGVDRARGELIALLNNDVEVLHPDWLRELATQALRPEIGAVGARLLYPGGAVQHGGVILGLGQGIAGHAHRGFPRVHPGYQGRAHLPQTLSAVTAACLVMRRQLYLQAGGLDAEHLAVAYNDVDLCLRLGQLGYRILWTPYAELRHRESTSRRDDRGASKPARLVREEEVMRQRWGELLCRDPAYNPNLTLDGEDFGLSWAPRR